MAYMIKTKKKPISFFLFWIDNIEKKAYNIIKKE